MKSYDITNTVSFSKEASCTALIPKGILVLFLKVSQILLRSRSSYDRKLSFNMPTIDFYCWQLPACSFDLRQYFTVTMEKASKHSTDRNVSNIPHRGTFVASSNTAMYLKKKVTAF